DAAARLLSPAERASLHEDRREEFTIDDVPLLDELAELLGTAPQQTQARDEAAREYAEAVVDMTETGGMVSAEMLADRWEEQGTSGYLVVAEAQELRPMQWRVLFRRVPSKSATVVGDLAQSSRADNARTWSPILSEFVGDRFALPVLTVSYRTPQSVMNLANR